MTDPMREATIRRPAWFTAGLMRPAGMALALGLLFGWLGPFGSYPALTAPARYLFWLTLIPLGAGLFLTARAWAEARLAALLPVVRFAVAVTASAVPHTLATACAMAVVQPERTIGVGDLPALFAAVASVQWLVALAGYSAPTPAPARRSAMGASRPMEPAPDLLARIPARLGRELIAVTAEDHYVRIHTALGSTLVLMRFADAAAALAGADGLQVKRGWWVARSAIRAVWRDGGRTTIRLSNGLQASVSRPFRAAVRELGPRR